MGAIISFRTSIHFLFLKKRIRAKATITRPSDTPGAYHQFDVINQTVATILTFSNVVKVNGGSGTIIGARLHTNVVTWAGRERLYLYNATITPIADHALHTLLTVNKDKRISSPIDFPATESSGTGSNCSESNNMDVRIPFVCDPNDRNLYGLLTDLDGSGTAPASGQIFDIYLLIEQD